MSRTERAILVAAGEVKRLERLARKGADVGEALLAARMVLAMRGSK